MFDEEKIQQAMSEFEERVERTRKELMIDLVKVHSAYKENFNKKILSVEDQNVCIIDWTSYHTAVLLELVESQAVIVTEMKKELDRLKQDDDFDLIPSLERDEDPDPYTN